MEALLKGVSKEKAQHRDRQVVIAISHHECLPRRLGKWAYIGQEWKVSLYR